MSGDAKGRSLKALSAVNFFLADVRDGLGPFLGIYLVAQGWQPDQIGYVFTLSSLAAMAATAPAGAWVDNTRRKRVFLSVCAFVVAVGALTVLISSSFGVIAAAQVAMGAAGAAIAPAITGLTLGLVGQTGLAGRIGRNEAWNHGGNAVAAALGGLFGFYFGIPAIVVMTAVMALASIVSVYQIKGAHIDDDAARGVNADDPASAGPKSWAVLLKSAPLAIFGLTIMLFHLGNAAMLPLLSQAATSRELANPAIFAALTVIIAQATMVPMALFAARVAETRGYWIVLVMALAVLPIRGLIAGYWIDPWAVVPVQILDGVAAGMIGVATPGLVARILAGSGHVNAGYGAVETLHRVGAAFSATLAGIVATRQGYDEAFLALGAVAVVALLVWLAATPIMRKACATVPASQPASSG